MQGNDGELARTPAAFLAPDCGRIAFCVSTTSCWNDCLRSQRELPMLHWVHVVLVRDERYSRIYIDGVLDAERKSKGQTLINAHPLYLGHTPPGVKGAAADYAGPAGMARGLRFYPRALSSEQVRVLTATENSFPFSDVATPSPPHASASASASASVHADADELDPSGSEGSSDAQLEGQPPADNGFTVQQWEATTEAAAVTAWTAEEDAALCALVTRLAGPGASDPADVRTPGAGGVAGGRTHLYTPNLEASWADGGFHTSSQPATPPAGCHQLHLLYWVSHSPSRRLTNLVRGGCVCR